MHRTLQDRLVNELRIHSIDSVEAANKYLREKFLPQYNKDFARPARESASAFVTSDGTDLDQVICFEYERTVNADNTVRLENVVLQIAKQPGRASCAGLRITVRRHLDGCISIWKGPTCYGKYDALGDPIQKEKGEKAGFQGMEGSRMTTQEKGSPQAPIGDIPSPSPGYPSAGCSPAGPASVSPGA